MHRRVIERVRRRYGDMCFACGPSNPLGLQIDSFELGPDGTVSASFMPRSHYRGAGDTLHGGIAATALDEILVWAGILTEGVMSVTGTLEIKYRRALTVNHPVTATAKVDERRGRRLKISGSLADETGVAVEGKGLYLMTLDLSELD